MRYEEVETVLPADFQPTKSNSSKKSKSTTHISQGKSNSERKTMIQRLRGSWRNSRRKMKKQSKEAAAAEGVEDIPKIRKVDSNATDKRSNTTKSKTDEERDAESVSAVASLPSIREGSGTPNTDLGCSGDDMEEDVANLEPSLVKDFSIEVGDESDHVEVGIMSPKSFAGDTIQEETADEIKKASSRESQSSTKSNKSATKEVSQALVVKEPVIVEDVDEESMAENDALALAGTPTDTKWAKKVSISIGGYKTSFQFSDPLSNLAQKVNEALDVVGDESLMKEAEKLDEIGDKLEEERDYDVNPTKLFMYLQQRAWGLALQQLQKNPEEAKVWVYRKQTPKAAENVKDGYKSEALVLASQDLVVHDGNTENKLRWKLLPLHASIVLGAPVDIIVEIIRVYPAAARKPDERGSLPVHLAASRLDVDPDGEKVVLHLFGAYPDSIQAQDRKGRTPPELAKLARGRKDAENERRLNAEFPGIEKTASEFKHDVTVEDDDDCSVKSGISQRFKMMLKGSKSMDVHDRRKKKGKKKSVSGIASVCSLSKARSVDVTEGDEMGPGFAILKPAATSEVSVRSLMDDDEEEDTAPALYSAGSFYTPPSSAPSSTDAARSIPLPKSFSVCEDDAASVRSNSSKASVKSNGSKASIKSTGSKSKANAADVLSPKSVETLPPSDGSEQPTTEDAEAKATKADETHKEETVNESLRLLLEKAAENVGRSGEDVSSYMKDLEDEWVTDVEALRRLDGETLDNLLPIVLSREVQRLMSQADNIDDKFLTEDTETGKWVRSDKIPELTESRGRSSNRKGKKKSKRSSARKVKRSLHSLTPQDSLNAIAEEDDDAQTVYSVRTEAPNGDPLPVQSHSSSKVRIHETPTEVNEYESEEQHEIDSELKIRKMHANLIADARKKFPTRESLEDAIRERQQQVEAAVNSGFDVDKQTLSRAALADDEVRRLLPLRLILPSINDLREMVGVLQVHKENALRNSNLKKAVRLQDEIDELESQLDLEKKYVLKRKIEMATASSKCLSCGEPFTPETKMVGILKTKEYKCPKCRGTGLIASLMGNVSPKVESVPEKKQEEGSSIS
jgi:DNA-directed RNA polymerase subunit RPC12/RpoP